jgi:opacity protein-like surface antigen
VFKNNNYKQKESIKEVVKMKNILICMVFVVVAFCATNAWAITTPVSAPAITVNATVPTVTGGLSVVVSKVIGTDFTPATSMSFGTLVLDPDNHIFIPADKSYYAVDIGVSDNTGTDWRVTQARASMVRPAGGNIDNKVNVTFVKQTSSTVGTELKKVSFNASNATVYTKTQLAGGWLRIYYGIGTGGTVGNVPGGTPLDASDVTPIGLDTPAGTYTGSVTITLAP